MSILLRVLAYRCNERVVMCFGGGAAAVLPQSCAGRPHLPCVCLQLQRMATAMAEEAIPAMPVPGTDKLAGNSHQAWQASDGCGSCEPAVKCCSARGRGMAWTAKGRGIGNDGDQVATSWGGGDWAGCL